MLLFAFNVFLSAFLLFQIELIIANYFLPIYGGSYAVWGSCVVFFQTILLLGYTLAKFLPEWLGMQRYRKLHLIFMLLPMFFFPGRNLQVFEFSDKIPITFNIFAQLLCNIGAVFLVLSFMSIINQVWLSMTRLKEKTNPYVLFAVSNLGSFGGLLTYPFFFEAQFGVQNQLLIWRVGYALLLLVNLAIVLKYPIAHVEKTEQPPAEKIPGRIVAYWLLLSAAGVAFFLSVTNVVTLEIVPMPLLWVIPLCIYLISFTLNFKKNPWCPKWITEHIHIFIGLAVMVFFVSQRKYVHFVPMALIYFFLTFVFCMFCQRELHNTRPSPQRLSFFYVINALGGFIGGAFVSWVIPLISHSLVEFLYALLLLAMALLAGRKSKPSRFFDWGLLLGLLLVMRHFRVVFPNYGLIPMALLTIMYVFVFSNYREKYVMILATVALIIGLKPWIGFQWRVKDFTFSHRNYYGIYHIYEEDEKKHLLHGQIIHGLQYVDPEKQMDPLLYYHPDATFGRLFSTDLIDFDRVGIIGLGVGVLATYAQPGQVYDFYELDYDDLLIAQNRFTFLKNARGKINNIIGDARLTIKDAPQDIYDLFVVDAFTGDSIPSHLITNEAVERYRYHMKDDGILFFHISNRYLRLGPVLARIAQEQNAYFAWQQIVPKSKDVFSATCVAMTWDKDRYDILTNELDWDPIDVSKASSQRLWTDDYSNILSILKTNAIWRSFTRFNFLRLY